MSDIKVDSRGREQVKAWYIIVVDMKHEFKILDSLRKLSNFQGVCTD
jgi:hypothetical protein